MRKTHALAFLTLLLTLFSLPALADPLDPPARDLLGSNLAHPSLAPR